MKTAQFNVSNVKCQGCVSNIQSGLGDLPGVTEVRVDIPAGTVTVTGEALEREALIQKLARLGYPVIDKEAK